MSAPEKINANIPYRPLGIVKNIIESLGAEISYVYEDLIFIKHNHFLLRFGDVGEKMFFHRNEEIPKEEAADHFSVLRREAAGHGISLTQESSYRLEESSDGELRLAFMENPQEIH
jgi:hypothetical protein